MAIFGKWKVSAPATATDVVQDDSQLPSALDLEKRQHGSSKTEVIPQTRNEKIDPVLEKVVVRKMDWRVVSLVTALYVLAFLDRSNIGNARIAGMREDLKLEGSDYQWLLNMHVLRRSLGITQNS